MATKNIGQVAGLWIGTSAPSNTSLIWFDSTPAILCHKVYNSSLSAWVVLDVNVISSITYSELQNVATTTGLTQGSWYKITDKGNILALALTSTKIQYADSNSNIIVDDLASSKIYFISSNNFELDGLQGVWDDTNKILSFSFSETNHDGSTDDDYLLGKKERNSVFSWAKYKLKNLVSAATGNAISWNKGIFFNFISSIKTLYDKKDGIVSKQNFDSVIDEIETSLNNVAEENSGILVNSKNYVDAEVVAAKIYNKALPTAPTISGETTDISNGDTLLTIVSKIQRWINKFKYATGISLSSNFAAATQLSDINNNDTVESALGKVQYWFANMKLGTSWTSISYEATINDVAAGDTFQDAFSKVQGKFNQLGIISNGLLKSRVNIEGKQIPVSSLNLATGEITLSKTESNRTVISPSGIDKYTESGRVSRITDDGIFSSAANVEVFPQESVANSKASLVGFGFNNVDIGNITALDDNLTRSFLAGVAGIALNSAVTPADTFGGYFRKIKILGLYLRTISIPSSYLMLETDDIVACNNTSAITVTLPNNPTPGKIVLIYLMNNQQVTILSTLPWYIHTASGGRNNTSLLIGNTSGYGVLGVVTGTFWTFFKISF